MRERLQQIQQMIERSHKHITSPADDALLDICTALLNEIATLDAEVSLIESGEGPTGCADDNDELARAMRGLSQQDLDRILREALNPLERETETTTAG